MLTNSYGPEYGQASGAVISITTRSGENQFHGGVFYEGRNDKLNANSFANNSFAGGTPKPPLRRNDYGYFVSGPIKKDKLFFWWNEEWNKDNRGNLVSTCVPTAAERAGDFSDDVAKAMASLNPGAPPRTTLRAMHRLQQILPTMEPPPIPTSQPHPEFRWPPRPQGTNLPSPTRTP